ncbi:MAG: tetratricopeptide repeat protein, partial [Planctomycetota bacterium]
MTRSSASKWMLAICLLSFGLYAPSLGNLFAKDDRYIAISVFDDGLVNRPVYELGSITDYFTSSYWGSNEDIKEAPDPLYRPVTILSYALLYHGFGTAGDEEDEALPQHFVNVLLHVLGTWLSYLLIRRLLIPRVPALLGALVFGLHAIHSEVVAGIVGRAELLSYCFGALALLLALGGDLRRRVAAGVCLFLAFCSKESALAWAPFMVVFDLGRRAGMEPSFDLKARLIESGKKVAIIAGPAIAIFLVLRQKAVGDLGEAQTAPAVNFLVDLDATAQLLTAIKIWGYGLWKTLFPFSLRGEYSEPFFTAVNSVFDPAFLASAVILIGITLGACRVLKTQPLLFVAMATFMGFSFITSNVPRVIGTIFGERLFYIPSLGMCFLVAWLGMRAAGSARLKRGGIALLTVWCSYSAWIIIERNPAWYDSDSLSRADGKLDDAPSRALYELALILGKENKFTLKRDLLERANAQYPELAEVWNEIGKMQVEAGDPAAALESFRRGLNARNCPDETRFILVTNLFGLYLQEKDFDTAREVLLQAVKLGEQKLAEKLVRSMPQYRRFAEYQWFRGVLGELMRASKQPLMWRSIRGRMANDFQQYQDAIADLQVAA